MPREGQGEDKMWGEKKVKEPEVKCSLVESPDIYIEAIARQKIGYLMEEYSNQEWLAYLIGEEIDKKNFFVEDISVPPHEEVSGGSAEAVPFNIPDRCIGVIHSHHTMGAFHSGTDHDHVDRNFPVSITVARNDGNLLYNGVSSQITECGRMVSVKADVKYVQYPPLFDKDGWLKEAKKNIDQGKKKAVIPRFEGYNFDEYGLMAYDPEEEAYVQTQNLSGALRPKSKKKQVARQIRKSLPVRHFVTSQEVERVQSWIKNVHGLDMTRAEVEDLLLATPSESQLEEYFPQGGWNIP